MFPGIFYILVGIGNKTEQLEEIDALRTRDSTVGKNNN